MQSSPQMFPASCPMPANCKVLFGVVSRLSQWQRRILERLSRGNGTINNNNNMLNFYSAHESMRIALNAVQYPECKSHKHV